MTFALRTFVIYNRNWFVAVLLVCIGTARACVNLVLFSFDGFDSKWLWYGVQISNVQSSIPDTFLPQQPNFGPYACTRPVLHVPLYYNQLVLLYSIYSRCMLSQVDVGTYVLSSLLKLIFESDFGGLHSHSNLSYVRFCVHICENLPYSHRYTWSGNKAWWKYRCADYTRWYLFFFPTSK